VTVTNKNIGIVVPTRNRPENIKNLLVSIEGSSVHPAVCIIVDWSDEAYDLPSCSFPILFETPGIRGQVHQRNFGIRKLSEFGAVKYALLLDDDILLEPDTIAETLAGIARYEAVSKDFVGFALNITNLRNANHVFRRLLLHPRKPGAVSRSTFNSSLSNPDSDLECSWVLGGAAAWSLPFLVKNPSDYPFPGKAYSEDLYYCSMVRESARFAAFAKARCRHVDYYELRASENVFRSAYREGVSDTKIRMSIARKFRQYSTLLTAMHVVWVGAVGMTFGAAALDRAALGVGIGRIIGLTHLAK
jgi:glycosyltransferase involved in cell wall biosynthesis